MRISALSIALVALLAACAAPAGPPTSTVDTAGLDVLGDNTIHRPDGPAVRLALPAGRSAVGGVTLPAGWLVEVREPEEHSLWYADQHGDLRYLTRLAGAYTATASTLVAPVDEQTVVAYGLPDGGELRRVRWPDPEVHRVGDDVILLTSRRATPGPTRVARWSLATGALDPVPEPRWLLGGPLSREGACLVWSDPAGRYCAPVVQEVISGSVSPDGTLAALSLLDSAGTTGLVLARVTELRAGTWRPTWLDPDSTVEFWDTAGTLVVRVGDGPYSQCDLEGCADLELPAAPASPDLAGLVLLPRSW